VHASQALPLWSDLTNNKLRKQRQGTFLASFLNTIIGITSYYCVILKMVMLHDAIEAIQNIFSFFKRAQPVSFQKPPKKTD